MNSFERPAQPNNINSAAAAFQDVANQHDALLREHAYQSRYNSEILPLVREEEKLKIYLGVATEKLRGAQAGNSANSEILALQKQLRALRGEPEPDTAPGTDSALTAAQLEYDTAKAALDTKRGEIAERTAELRRAHSRS